MPEDSRSFHTCTVRLSCFLINLDVLSTIETIISLVHLASDIELAKMKNIVSPYCLKAVKTNLILLKSENRRRRVVLRVAVARCPIAAVTAVAPAPRRPVATAAAAAAVMVTATATGSSCSGGDMTSALAVRGTGESSRDDLSDAASC